MKRVISLMLAVLMLLSIFTGCAGKQETGADTTSVKTTNSGTTQTASEPEVVEEDLTPEIFTIFWPDQWSNHDNFESPVAQKITGKTGVKLQFEFPVGDVSERISLMMASDEYPDLIAHKENSMALLVDAKALIKLDDYINKDGPNIREFYGDLLKRLRFSETDKSIYSFGAGGVINDSRPGRYWGTGFALQYSALKEAGYPQVKSLQDYENIIKTYVDKHPQTDGKPTIGISLIASDGWRHLISVTNPAFLVTGAPDNGEWFVKPDYSVILHHTRPEEKEYFRWLNKMNNIGLLDKETFTQTYDAYNAKIASGRVVGLVDGLWEYNEGNQKLINDGKFDKQYLPFPIVMDTSTQKWSLEMSDGKVSLGGISITKACKKPEKIVKFFNFLASEEGQILKDWGIEGEHYDVVDGKRVMKPELVKQDREDGIAFTKTTGVKLYGHGGLGLWLSHGYGKKDSDGNLLQNFSAENEINGFSDVEKEALKAYGVTNFVDLFPKATDFPVRPYGAASNLQPGQTEETKVIWQKVRELTIKDIARAVMVKPSEFDTEWEKFMKDLQDVGLSQLEAEMTTLLKERLEIWK